MKKTLIAAASAAVLTLVAAPALAQSASPSAYGTVGYSHLDGYDTQLGAVTGRLGAKFNSWFGVEGEASIGVRDDTVTLLNVPVDVELEYDAAAYAVASVPVSPNLELFARVGYGTTSLKAQAAGFSSSEDGDSVNYGAGATYSFDGQNGIRGDWTRRDFDNSEVDVWSLSYVRRF